MLNTLWTFASYFTVREESGEICLPYSLDNKVGEIIVSPAAE